MDTDIIIDRFGSAVDVVSKYVGSGHFAELVYALDQEQLQEREPGPPGDPRS